MPCSIAVRHFLVTNIRKNSFYSVSCGRANHEKYLPRNVKGPRFGFLDVASALEEPMMFAIVNCFVECSSNLEQEVADRGGYSRLCWLLQ